MVLEIKKILYATDLSKNSAYAFRYAVDMASRHDGKIIILHVLEPVPAYVRNYLGIYMGEEEWEKKVKSEEQETVERIKRRLNEFCNRTAKNGIPCLDLISEILVRAGHPVDEILRTSEEKSCDIIILGTHGKGFLLETFLGSVARSVLDRTRKPVLIIPLPKGELDLSLDI